MNVGSSLKKSPENRSPKVDGAEKPLGASVAGGRLERLASPAVCVPHQGRELSIS